MAAMKVQGGRMVPADDASAKAMKAILLDAQRHINALRRLDLPRNIEATVIQLDEQVMDAARQFLLKHGQ